MLGLANLVGFIGDLSAYDLDKPILEDFVIRANTSNSHKTLELARGENLTIRQLYQKIAGKAGIRQIIGTPSEIADDMQHGFDNGTCNGFNLCPSHPTGAIADFAELVVPELQRRGLFRKRYEFSLLRENLWLVG